MSLSRRSSHLIDDFSMNWRQEISNSLINIVYKVGESCESLIRISNPLVYFFFIYLKPFFFCKKITNLVLKQND